MLLNALLLFCTILNTALMNPPDMIISTTPDGVEVRMGDYVMTGSKIAFDQKKQVMMIEGSEKIPARIEIGNNGQKLNTQQGKLLLVDLTSGKINVK